MPAVPLVEKNSKTPELLVLSKECIVSLGSFELEPTSLLNVKELALAVISPPPASKAISPAASKVILPLPPVSISILPAVVILSPSILLRQSHLQDYLQSKISLLQVQHRDLQLVVLSYQTPGHQ